MIHLMNYEQEIKAAAIALEPDEDFVAGVDIVFKCLPAPMMQIAENAGVDGSLAVEKCLGQEYGWGYNAATDTYENLLDAGILDPAKVTTNALENSVSIASLVLTTEALVTEIPKVLTNAQMADNFDMAGGMGAPNDYM